jgi:hypothetical protein
MALDVTVAKGSIKQAIVPEKDLGDAATVGCMPESGPFQSILGSTWFLRPFLTGLDRLQNYRRLMVVGLAGRLLLLACWLDPSFRKSNSNNL